MKSMKGMKREFTELSNRVIGCAIEVHRLGPGLLESTYPQCLAGELEQHEALLDPIRRCRIVRG